MHIIGNIVDIHQREIFYGEVVLDGDKIKSIQRIADEKEGASYILPGFVDAHVHVESSMLVPSEFARLALTHGTIGTVSDPHEIANVLGVEGVKFMIENGKEVPFHFCFGAPSCVPATGFETAGAIIDGGDLEKLFQETDITYLAEMMNWPGVLYEDPEVMEKLAVAKKYNKQIDGHAPGLRGQEAAKYASKGISTDHECFSYEEGLDKARLGMKILIREGSAAKNFEVLIPLIEDFPDQIMFCSDDKHPDSLELGHINQLVSRATKAGYPLFDVLRSACLHPVQHYRMKSGLLRVGDSADFIVSNDLKDFHIESTFIAGKKVAENGQALFQTLPSKTPNNFHCKEKKEADFVLAHQGEEAEVQVIIAEDGQLITKKEWVKLAVKEGMIQTDVEKDVLYITVVNRYQDAAPAMAMIKGFGFKEGAIASSVGHDSHNIIAVGADIPSLCRAVNLVIEAKGGISVVGAGMEEALALPVAGIMSNADGYEVAKAYSAIDQKAKQLGSRLSAPFMTASFMALLVIPSLKLSDKGLFDGERFEFVSVSK